MFRSGISALAVLALFAVPTWGVRHDDWVEVRSPNFIVVSNAGENAARATATQFEQIRAVFNAALPVATAHQGPVITILAVKDAASLRELLSPFWEKGHAPPAGIFSHRLDQFYIALERDLNGENPYANLYHEYFHSLTTPYYPDLPAWLAEGLAEFYGNTRIGNAGVTMGLPDAARIDQLTRGHLIPLPVLFKVDHASPYYNEELKSSMFYAESWALAHYLMVGDDGAHKQSLTDYLAAMNGGTTAEQAAIQTLGDLGALETKLARYVRDGNFTTLEAPSPPKATDVQLSVREISDAESIAYRGGFLAVQGQTGEAVRTLGKLVQANPKLALAQRNLAMALFFAGRRAEAYNAASKTIALEPRDALTHYIRAYLAFDGSMLPQKPQMEADLRAAIALNANFGSPYSMLAAYLAAQNKDLGDALAAAQKSVSFEPGNGAFQLVLAKVLGRMKRYDEARAATSAALADAKNPSERAEADHFLSFLDRSGNLPTDARLTHPLQP
jgi:tetratricopeptide (TPR) repeat protein